MPPLLVFPSRFARGAWALREGLAVDKRGDLPELGYYWPDGREGLLAEYDCDAHCVAYTVDGIPNETPRLTKRIARELAAVGLSIVVHWVFLDVDNPQHTPWECPEGVRLDVVADHIEAALGARPGWYVTRCGYRLVWPLDEPLGVDIAEGMLSEFVCRVRSLGYAVDERCTDWTRFFRCPRVVRGGVLQRFPLEL